MKFEEKLYLLREEKKISQNELAEILDVSRQSISKWEVGRAKPDTNHLILISQYFNVSLDYLVNDDINDKNEKIHIRKNVINIEESKTVKKHKKGRIYGIIFVILGIAMLIGGNVFHSSIGASIGFISIGIVFMMLIIYTQIRDLVHQAKNKKERSEGEKKLAEDKKYTRR